MVVGADRIGDLDVQRHEPMPERGGRRDEGSMGEFAPATGEGEPLQIAIRPAQARRVPTEFMSVVLGLDPECVQEADFAGYRLGDLVAGGGGRCVEMTLENTYLRGDDVQLVP